MKGKRSTTIAEITEILKQEQLLAIPKCVFQKCFEDWKIRWHKCIISEKGYFEGNNTVVDKLILFEIIENNSYFLIISLLYSQRKKSTYSVQNIE